MKLIKHPKEKISDFAEILFYLSYGAGNNLGKSPILN